MEKVVSKSECKKLFRPRLNYHNIGAQETQNIVDEIKKTTESLKTLVFNNFCANEYMKTFNCAFSTPLQSQLTQKLHDDTCKDAYTGKKIS